MKVYIVEHLLFGDFLIEAVFNTKKEAQQFIENNKNSPLMGELKISAWKMQLPRIKNWGKSIRRMELAGVLIE